MAADFERLARAHQIEQVKQAAVIQQAVSLLWDRTVDAADLDRSFASFEVAARRFVNAGRTIGAKTAERYYGAVRQLAGLDGVVDAPRVPFDDQATRKALYATGYATAKRQLADGADVGQAMSSAKVAALRAAKRRTLGGGRETVLAHTRADPHVDRWARVSDGKPCAFCAMLVSRGPVYAEGTVRFRAHDGCGCSARPVPKGDPTGGWTDDAREYRRLYDQSDGLGGGGDNDFRNLLARSRASSTPVPAPVPPSPLDVLPKLKTKDVLPDALVTNPGVYQGADWQNNCHYVVASVELRARGYDVIARPTAMKLGRYDEAIRRDWVQADGTHREFSKLIAPGSNDRRRTATILDELTAEWPEGARGYVRGAWKTGGGGHIFTMEKTATGLRFHEGQVPRSDPESYLAKMDRKSVSLMRVDDLEPTDRLLNAVEPATPARVAQLGDRTKRAEVDAQKKREELTTVQNRIDWNLADIRELTFTANSRSSEPKAAAHARVYVIALEAENKKLAAHLATLKGSP